MGNNSSSQGLAVGDDFQGSKSAARGGDSALSFVEHSFKGELHTCTGSISVIFGECQFAKRPVEIICKGNSVEIVEQVDLGSKNDIEIAYEKVSAVGWDHSRSQVKLSISDTVDNTMLILTLADSIEFETEMKLRFSGCLSLIPNFRMPSVTYMGIFSGATKPKAFQRQRPNQSLLPQGKIPPVTEMRSTAQKLYNGTYKPCPDDEDSRRLNLAFRHIYEGFNSFPVLSITGPQNIARQWSPQSKIVVSNESISLSGDSSAIFTWLFADIKDWNAVDLDSDSCQGKIGIEVSILSSEESIFVEVQYLRDVKHSIEYFWNSYQVSMGLPVKLGSTHGRPIVSVTTLSGEVAPGDPVIGSTEVVDLGGLIVRPGTRLAPRPASMISASVGMGSKEPIIVPRENPDIKNHWHKVVLHQGWLLKQGGIGIDAGSIGMGNIKSWMKRYFVLYKTSQGHFLAYYNDFLESPMYTSEKNHRNIIDLAKTTHIRLASPKQELGETPPHSFDIVTTEREWTLCAESRENAAKWLKLLNRAIDDDNAVLPDEEHVFTVKAKKDPVGVLPSDEYSTYLRVSAMGVAVTAIFGGRERECFFWAYTDFCNWSLISQKGKLAIVLDVFADASLEKRNEFIFRTTDAVRLVTFIEYYIEKFMNVMHLRLELLEGIPSDLHPMLERRSDFAVAGSHACDAISPPKTQQQLILEMPSSSGEGELLDFGAPDGSPAPINMPPTAQPMPPSLSPPKTSAPFMSAPARLPPVPSIPPSERTSDDFREFGSSIIPVPQRTSDAFGDSDPFA